MNLNMYKLIVENQQISHKLSYCRSYVIGCQSGIKSKRLVSNYDSPIPPLKSNHLTAVQLDIYATAFLSLTSFCEQDNIVPKFHQVRSALIKCYSFKADRK